MNLNLNNAQQQAVKHKDGPMLILAGPGSGKTTVILARIHYLTTVCGVSPEKILVSTFSRAAAEELKDRCRLMAGPSSSQVTFGTLHSIFLKILKETYRFSSQNILRDGQKYTFLKIQTEKLGLKPDNEKEFLVRLAGEISRAKSCPDGLSDYRPESVTPELFRKIYDGYNRELTANRLLDYDDILIRCHRLLTDRPDLLKTWQQRYTYILIDEFQDINQIQYETIRLLASKHRNLFVVGDDDQSIYGFRGARPQILKTFLADFPESGQILLNVNYRCCPGILKKSLQLISVNKNRLDKKLVPAPGAGQKEESDLPSFRIRKYRRRTEEMDALAAQIQKQSQTGCDLRKTAVLFRSLFDALVLVQKLEAANLPFSMTERLPGIFETFIAKDITAYIRASLPGCSRKDLIRILNRPVRFLSRDAVEDRPDPFGSLQDFYKGNLSMQKRVARLQADLHMIKDCSPFAAISYIRYAIGYETYLIDYAKETSADPGPYLEILDCLLESAASFSNSRDWLAFAEQKKAGMHEEGGIRIMTMHASKGLEFDTVYLPCLNNGVLPHRKALGKEALEEERRLFYVAMTRAKNHLFLSWSETVRNKASGPSEFLQSLQF